MTCLQWFLDNLQNPLQSFWNFAVDWNGFRNTLDFSLDNGLSRLYWQSSKIPWAWSCLDPSLHECTVKLFEATKDDHRECLDTHYIPHRCSELVVGVLLNWEIVNCFCQCTIKMIAKAKTEHGSCKYKGHIVLETRTSSEVETRFSFAVETQLSRT